MGPVSVRDREVWLVDWICACTVHGASPTSGNRSTFSGAMLTALSSRCCPHRPTLGVMRFTHHTRPEGPHLVIVT
eukprot:366127-Chlamydomonas_euryale.AAC.7